MCASLCSRFGGAQAKSPLCHGQFVAVPLLRLLGLSEILIDTRQCCMPRLSSHVCLLSRRRTPHRLGDASAKQAIRSFGPGSGLWRSRSGRLAALPLALVVRAGWRYASPRPAGGHLPRGRQNGSLVVARPSIRCESARLWMCCFVCFVPQTKKHRRTRPCPDPAGQGMVPATHSAFGRIWATVHHNWTKFGPDVAYIGQILDRRNTLRSGRRKRLEQGSGEPI